MSLSDLDKYCTVEQVLEAAIFATAAHGTQMRKSLPPIPYISHPLEVALLAAQAQPAREANLRAVILGAILHDVVEDTSTTLQEIEHRFGADVAELVQHVTDDKSLPKVDRKKLQIVHAADSATPIGAKIIKLADKLHNTRSLLTFQPKGWSAERVQGYFVWSKAVVDAMRGTNASLEAALDEVFGSQFHMSDGSVAGSIECIPLDAKQSKESFAAHLENYYAGMVTAND